MDCPRDEKLPQSPAKIADSPAGRISDTLLPSLRHMSPEFVERFQIRQDFLLSFVPAVV
jgi:hypothetical protein